MKIIAILTLCGLSLFPAASGQEYFAEILVSKAKGERLKGLVLKPRVPVQIEERDGAKIATVELEGELKSQNLSLYLDDERLVEAGESRRDFKVEVPLKGRVTPLPLVAENQKGKRKNIKAIVRFKDFAALKASSGLVESKKEKRASRSASRVNLSVSMGVSTVTYRETPTTGTATAASILGLTGKVAGNYFFSPPNWDLGINAFITALPLSTTFTTAPTGVTSTTQARFLGINGRIGYRVGFAKSRATLRLMLGWYYTTMMVSGYTSTVAPFGFSNMSGPQLFPVFSYRIGQSNLLVTYVKYSPILGIISLSDRELAAGLGYIMELGKGGSNLSFNFDYANIAFVVPNQGAVNSTSLNFSLGYGFAL